MEKIAQLVKRGLAAPEWMTNQLASVQAYREAAEVIVSQASAEAAHHVKDAVKTAVQYGDASAAAELGEALRPAAQGALSIATQNVAALAAEATLGRIAETHFQILRSSEDAYRRIILETMNAPLLGVETRKVAAQRALNRFAQEGISVMTQGGRRYQISSYVDMAMRTSLMNATLQGHANRLEKSHVDLVMVSDHTQECKMCRPFEGKVLSLKGDVRGTIEVPNAKGGGTVEVEVFGSLAEARSKGLFHPNCRHTFGAYVPGVTRGFGETADPQGDKDRQKLRKLERDIRGLRKLESVALDDTQAKDIRAAIRAKQGQIRDHVLNTSAKRQPDRERITGAFGKGDASRVIDTTPKPKPTPKAAPKKRAPAKAKAAKPVDVMDAKYLKSLSDDEFTDVAATFFAQNKEGQRTVFLDKVFKARKLDMMTQAGPLNRSILERLEAKYDVVVTKESSRGGRILWQDAPGWEEARNKALLEVHQANLPDGHVPFVRSGGVGSKTNPHAFSDADGQTYGMSHWESDRSKLPKADGDALYDYTSPSFQKLNAYARTGKGEKPAYFDEIDRVLDEAPRTEEWLTVNRGTYADELGLPKFAAPHEMIGKTVNQKGWTSGALKEDTYGGAIKLELHVPPGTKAYYVGGQEGMTPKQRIAKLAAGEETNELVLGRDIEYRIIDVVPYVGEGTHQWRVIAEVVAQNV
jgi:hypothetical protein